jgi:hypothetical protein
MNKSPILLPTLNKVIYPLHMKNLYLPSDGLKLFSSVNLPEFSLGSVRYVILNPGFQIDFFIIMTILKMLYDYQVYKFTILVTPKKKIKITSECGNL